MKSDNIAGNQYPIRASSLSSFPPPFFYTHGSNTLYLVHSYTNAQVLFRLSLSFCKLVIEKLNVKLTLMSPCSIVY